MKEDASSKDIELIATRLVEQVRDACKINKKNADNPQPKEVPAK